MLGTARVLTSQRTTWGSRPWIRTSAEMPPCLNQPDPAEQHKGQEPGNSLVGWRKRRLFIHHLALTEQPMGTCNNGRRRMKSKYQPSRQVAYSPLWAAEAAGGRSPSQSVLGGLSAEATTEAPIRGLQAQ